MALKFNEVFRPRPELLVIRQTRLEPTLMTVFGFAILSIGTYFMVFSTSGVWSGLSFHEQLLHALIIRYEDFLRMFNEGLNSNMDTANIVTFAFSSLILSFGIALFITGIKRLIKPVEHHFDHRNKSYLRNNKMIARFDEIQDIYTRRRTSSSEGSTSTWYQLYLVLRSRKPIKLMKTSSGERALELVEEMTAAIGLEPDQEEEDTTSKQYLSWTYPEWLKWVTLLSIGLFIIFWVNGFFDLGLIPENWNFWFFGIIATGWVLMLSAPLFGKIKRAASKSDVHEISKESKLSKKIRFISIIISILTVAIAIYLYFSSTNTKKDKPVNTNSIIREISLLDEKFSFSSEKWIKEENEYISAGISSGKYVVKLKETFGSGTYRASNPVRFCRECDLSIETSKIKGDMFWGYGLYFGGVEVGMSFLINGSGKYALREYGGDSIFYNKTGDFEFSPHINQGNGNNLLKVQYKGDHVIMWANGEQLESIPINPSFRITRAGLVVDTISNSRSKKVFAVHFDNLRYYMPK